MTTLEPTPDMPPPVAGEPPGPPPRSTTALRVVLGLTGAFIFVFGLNMALGGIETLGWEGRSDFVEIVDRSDFDVQDNHVRFVSGVWTAMGLVYLAATRWVFELRTTLLVLSGMIVVGGLARLSSGSLPLVTGPSIVGSFAAELVLVPLLSWWIVRATAPAGGEAPTAPARAWG